jgi:transposase
MQYLANARKLHRRVLAMLHIDFTENEIQALHFERFHHPHPRVQLKMEALLLKSHRLPHEKIAAILNIDEFTLRAYFRDYLHGGIQQLKVQRWRGNPNELAPHGDTLKTHFLQHPPTTAAQAGEQIAELTGIRRKPTQVRQFLKSIGMKPRKMEAIPAKADPQVQHDYLKKNSNPSWNRP